MSNEFKIKGKDVYRNGEIVGRICGYREHVNYRSSRTRDGYYVALNDGTRLGWNHIYDHGSFAYFQDITRWIRSGGINVELAA